MRLQIEGGTQDEHPRPDDPVGIRPAVGEGRNRLQSPVLRQVAHVELNPCVHLVLEQPRPITEQQVEIRVPLVVNRAGQVVAGHDRRRLLRASGSKEAGFSGGSGPGGAWWELDELAVNQSILRGRRGRIMLGTWDVERRRRKGGLRARIEALLAVWGQTSRNGVDRELTSGLLVVKEPAFLELR